MIVELHQTITFLSDHIFVAKSSDGSNKATLKITGLDRPRAILVSPLDRYLSYNTLASGSLSFSRIKYRTYNCYIPSYLPLFSLLSPPFITLVSPFLSPSYLPLISLVSPFLSLSFLPLISLFISLLSPFLSPSYLPLFSLFSSSYLPLISLFIFLLSPSYLPFYLPLISLLSPSYLPLITPLRAALTL